MIPEPRHFRVRMKIQSRLRDALEKRGYLEVATNVLQPAPAADPEIESMETRYSPLMETRPPAADLFLHTSPEFAMKRLMCRGERAVYQICPVFRQGEKGPLHSPEFTMAEWYRQGFSADDLAAELEQTVAEVLQGRAVIREKEIEVSPPFKRVPIKEALKKAGARPEEWDGLMLHEWREKFHRACVDFLDPWLEKQGAVFLTRFPAQVAQLARTRKDDPDLSSRFELYLGGIELANGCEEITDPAQHRLRFEQDRDIRKARGQKLRPLPDHFLQDLERLGMPECAGAAMGVERLAMLAVGAERIEEVMALPFAQ